MIGVIAGAAGGGAVVIAVIVIIVLRRKGIICNGDRGARRRRRREHRSGCCFGCCQREDKRATDWKTVLNSSNAAFEGLQPNTFMKSQIDRDLTGSRTSSMSLISRSSAGTGMVSRQGGAWTAEDVTDTEKDHEMLAAELEEVLVGAEADGVPGAAAGLRKPSADQNILLPGVAVDESEADNSPDKGTSPVPTGGVKATKGSFKTKMAMFENGSDSPTTRHNPLFDELNQDTSVDNLKTIRQKVWQRRGCVCVCVEGVPVEGVPIAHDVTSMFLATRRASRASPRLLALETRRRTTSIWRRTPPCATA